MKEKVTLTRKFEFSASHRYWNDNWTKEKNEQVFGHNISPYGHGHNYDLFVTVSGVVSEETGMIINLSELKRIVTEILNNFDHKFLNLDTPYFKNKIPTTENLASVLFDLINKKLKQYETLNLTQIRLYVKQDTYVDIWRDA